MVRAKSDIRTELANAIIDLRDEFDSRIAVNEARTTDQQQDLQRSIDSKLAALEYKMRNDSVTGVDGAAGKPSWADVVSQEMETRVHGVTAKVTVLKQQAIEMQMD